VFHELLRRSAEWSFITFLCWVIMFFLLRSITIQSILFFLIIGRSTQPRTALT
jgi:hypothetical protein